jgi:hypothetical protein
MGDDGEAVKGYSRSDFHADDACVRSCPRKIDFAHSQAAMIELVSPTAVVGRYSQPEYRDSR